MSQPTYEEMEVKLIAAQIDKHNDLLEMMAQGGGFDSVSEMLSGASEDFAPPVICVHCNHVEDDISNVLDQHGYIVCPECDGSEVLSCYDIMLLH